MSHRQLTRRDWPPAASQGHEEKLTSPASCRRYPNRRGGRAGLTRRGHPVANGDPSNAND
jgi:hypothetical protein